MSTPNFAFVGASKAGSTWIYECLRAHPEIFVPAAKDIYYFDRYHSRGRAWYEAHFKGGEGFRAVGEVCHDYMRSDEAIARLSASYPSMRLICCLRDPYDRARSSFLFWTRNGIEFQSFEDALRKQPEIFEEGLYARHLQRIYKQFHMNNILVLLFDDILRSPAMVVRKLYRFLGVDQDFVPPSLQRRVNAAQSARSRVVARTARAAATQLRELGFANLVGRLKHNTIVRSLLYRELASGSAGVTISYPTWMVDAYNSDISDLERILDRSLEHWKRAPADVGI